MNSGETQRERGECHLLVVDDNEANRDVLSRRLIKEGFEVTCVDSGERALELALPSRVHLILLDVMMPGLSGLEVLAQLRKSHSAVDLPIIMVTARDEPQDVVQSLRLGANDHVVKPIDFPVLKARIELQLKLRALSRLKDEFLRIASHDLRNPLSFVALSAQDMAENNPPGSPLSERSHKRLLRMAVRCADMQRIISDFLDFEVLQDGALSLNLAQANLNDLVSVSLANHEPSARAKNVRLSTNLDASIGKFPFDVPRIGQVMDNLVGNAIKFGRAGDEVVLQTRRCGDEVVFEVRDSGCGVPQEELSRLFKKYSRLSARPTAGESSLGIGLFISKQIIELHGGRIGVLNNLDSTGCTFWFRLSSLGVGEEVSA